jgi:3-oxoacyl-[acyl-carrier-protein] synthase-1
MMAAGLCDAALVGGVDTLCLNTLFGFNSLQLLSDQPCRPCDINRNGISLGEAAGFALLEWKDKADEGSGISMVGYGESSDAYHMSSPSPDGGGARLSMQAAMETAQLAAKDIDYINLHGTGSQINDVTEDQAITSLFDEGMACTATKGYTGHTLAAAGITESIISFLSLQEGFVPATVNTSTCDPALKMKVVLDNESKSIRRVLTNSFGFGGNNCSLIFENTR